jgi:hypothetical protein
MRLPRSEAGTLEQAIQQQATEPTMAFLGSLVSGAPDWSGAELNVGSNWQVGNARQFIVCKPEGNSVAVYFEGYAWLDEEVGQTAEILFARD